ncbi:MAG: ankyrin repeat domain-containing protein [Minwuia sp.]|uniref:ankyrin repeat domain-containing protein n=1 Tax=Minwuia sp. TaxID=2493630 RepID=UPI003A85CEEA
MASAFHGAVLAGLIVGAPQLFGREPDTLAIPITIQIFDDVYGSDEQDQEQKSDLFEELPPIETAVVAEPEPAKPVEAPPADAPKITVPDVRQAAIEAAKRAERPEDSGPAPEPNQPGDIAVVYEQSAPLTPKEERPEATPLAPENEALPETPKALAAEIRRLEALKAQAQLRRRVAESQKKPQQAADVAEQIAALEQRLKRLSVAKAAARVPRVERPKSDTSTTPPELADAKRSKLTVTKVETPPKQSAVDILKQSQRREKTDDRLSPEDRERAKQSLERFRKAADEGIRSAEMNLAKALDKGKGAEQDKKKATEILEKLARRNYQPAQIELAKKHLTGDGVEKDKKRAYILLKTAADENNIVAKRALNALDKEMSAEDRQLAEEEAGKWRRFIDKQRAENKLTSTRQKQLDEELRVAMDKGNVQRMENLLRSGADPNAIDASGRDAIIAAAWRGREMVVELLIEKGVDIDTIDLEGRTPLTWASINGYEAIVEDLLNEGADPDTRDDAGLTPLMRAAWNGHDDVVRALLASGASPDITDGEGKTALDRAREEDWPQVVQMLEAAPRAN